MKLNAQLEEKITEDWARLFPGLGIYQSLWLLRLTGPLLSGICLETDSGNDTYQPLFHVHSLARPFPTVSLTLVEYLKTTRNQAQDSIGVAFHNNRYSEAAERMTGQALLPLAGPISADQALEAYHRYMTKPLSRYPLLLYEDMLAILVWCGQLRKASASLEQFTADVKSWPSTINVLKNVGGVEAWQDRCLRWIENPAIIKDTVKQQITRLDVEHLPKGEFLC